MLFMIGYQLTNHIHIQPTIRDEQEAFVDRPNIRLCVGMHNTESHDNMLIRSAVFHHKEISPGFSPQAELQNIV